MNKAPLPKTFLNRLELEEMLGLSYVTIWRMARRGEFPKSYRLSPGRVGWDRLEIEAWKNSRRTVGAV